MGMGLGLRGGGALNGNGFEGGCCAKGDCWGESCGSFEEGVVGLVKEMSLW